MMAAIPLSPGLSPLQNLATIAFTPPQHPSLSINTQPILSSYSNAVNLAVTTTIRSGSFSSPTASVGFAVESQDNGFGPAEAPPSAKRIRNLSHTSSDHDLLTDIRTPRKDSDTLLTPTDSKQNPKKRSSVSGDSLDYPRRRATIAVFAFFHVVETLKN